MLRLGRTLAQKASLTASAAAAATTANTTATKRSMCGLVAAIDDVWTPGASQVDPNNRERIPILDDREALRQTTRILDHRGPDGYQISTGTVGGQQSPEARWSMGHTRLAIVDPSNRFADMPFNLTFDKAGVDGKKKIVHLAANGEIYNHNKVYKDLVENDGGWPFERISGSDCEVIGHAYAKYGGPKTAAMLDGMFAFVVFEEDVETGKVKAFAARDPVGIKPLYYGRTKCSEAHKDDPAAYVFSSELKALVAHADPSTVVAIPPGHYWTPEEGLVCYYNPEWLRDDDYAPWETDPDHNVTDDEIREAFTKAVQKRMMADVDYGFFLSGGVDSCIVSHDLLPLYRKEREALGDDRPIPTFTVGMENSPDVMAAKGMVDALGGSKHITHSVRQFTADEVFDLIPKIIYHMETYEAELIRSAIPNWLLAERAAQDVKMVLTGEGADELFAGYLYFKDAETPRQVQNELRRIYGMLGNINLHRTDRMTMAHGLEARVPFLDTEFTRLAMSVDPARKIVDPEAVKTNSRGREKTLLRELFEGPNENGHSIPTPVLWRAKAMQCEGVGEDWVSILQRRVSSLVSDAEMAEAHLTYPINTPHTKEELYYRRIYDENFHGLEHVVKLWDGGGRAMGAAWKSDMYTREGLRDVNLLSHALQQNRAFSTSTSPSSNTTSRRSFSSLAVQSFEDEPYSSARASGYDEYEAWLTCGGDDRSLINEATTTNKYHIRPQPVDPSAVFRGSCTGNPPTERGYQAGKKLFDQLSNLDDAALDKALGKVFENQRQRLSDLLQLEEGTEIIICPSGSDAEYLPIAIARAIKGDVHIANGVTQLREIGAGTAPAALGKYFSSHAPLVGRLPDEAEYLTGFEGCDGITIAAREKNGDVINASAKMTEFVTKSLADGVYPIVHGVFGGKTGVRDEQMPASLDGGETSLGVVDACQGRFSLHELHEWLNQDSLVLFTSSKFYQAPPFCGAVIIPPAIAEKLRSSSPPGPREMFSEDGLGGFLTDKELPECMESWKPLLRQNITGNLGLALRWEAGLAGMEALASIPDDKRSEAVQEWAGSVSEMVKHESKLDPWCVERSIVSIRVAKGEDGEWLSMSELRDLYRWMSMDVSGLVPDATPEEKMYLSKPAYIGQPVDVAETHAIVRIALGVESLLSYMDDKVGTLEEDRSTVQKLQAIGKHFDTLKKSGQ
mmetsp:Transcript_59754/g.146665  ORF Transcript_59754/g.146665 Transcript_59754/m.146665 type:complete len:1189 (-) Transcript_59754:1054-4620(-)